MLKFTKIQYYSKNTVLFQNYNTNSKIKLGNFLTVEKSLIPIHLTVVFSSD